MSSSFEKHDEKTSNEVVTNSTSGIVSDNTMETTQIEQINIDGVVNANMLHAHLAMLAQFNNLEQKDSEVDQRFLLRSEKRYLLWLELLNNGSFKDAEEVPIPPIDVCLIWHAHLLSPFRYYEDMRRLHDPLSKEYNFPLAKLHETWSQTKGDHIDERSKQFWEENTKQPWVLDPNDTSNFELVCPWCSTTLMMAATVDGEYSEVYAISDSDYLFNLSTWKKLIDKSKKSSEDCNWAKVSEIAAVILPPYAIYLAYKMNQYQKGTAKQKNSQDLSQEDIVAVDAELVLVDAEVVDAEVGDVEVVDAEVVDAEVVDVVVGDVVVVVKENLSGCGVHVNYKES
ncbi:8894_t:CDS:2, partial [Racocetra fulgida]